MTLPFKCSVNNTILGPSPIKAANILDAKKRKSLIFCSNLNGSINRVDPEIIRPKFALQSINSKTQNENYPSKKILSSNSEPIINAANKNILSQRKSLNKNYRERESERKKIIFPNEKGNHVQLMLAGCQTIS